MQGFLRFTFAEDEGEGDPIRLLLEPIMLCTQTDRKRGREGDGSSKREAGRCSHGDMPCHITFAQDRQQREGREGGRDLSF